MEFCFYLSSNSLQVSAKLAKKVAVSLNGVVINYMKSTYYLRIFTCSLNCVGGQLPQHMFVKLDHFC